MFRGGGGIESDWGGGKDLLCERSRDFFLGGGEGGVASFREGGETPSLKEPPGNPGVGSNFIKFFLYFIFF